MTTSSDFRAIAREKLRGNWGKSILITFVATLLGGVSGGGGHAASGSGSDTIATIDAIPEELYDILAIVAIFGIIVFFIGAVVELGHNKYYITLVRSNTTLPLGTLFENFNIFFKALGLRALILIQIALWSLLLVVPGIIAAFRYSQATYIMAEDPSISIGDAIKKSCEMMRGNKFRLFRLDLSFIGWTILCLLTCGIGFIWLNPYVFAAQAAFHLEVSGEGKSYIE